MLKRILGSLLVVLVLAVAGAYLLPQTVHVQRSVVVARPAAAVFPYLNSFHRAQEWSPWATLDPNAKMTYSGPVEGVGAELAWAGNDQVGHGSERIIESDPDRRVAVELDFGGQGRATSAFTLAPDGARTRVTWSVDMDVGNSPVGRYMGLYLSRAIGADYERGLVALRTVAEKAPAAADGQPASAPSTSPNAPTS